ncbi:hypothetical protein DPEC_G00219890 [Dallia pectoralis]|uniref:Uncharacterized protein n=1 Tax=Dallia pectoralis TaxID=75939 RepID=A0ACC2G3R6_DALPE|nr:hypothetical protein DPEC_G00219890 [Dallia pectoralis]
MRREVTFLGHQVGEKGVGTLLDKVEAVRDWPVPTTKQQVKSFLGLASNYRRFVKGFANIAFPLTGLLGKNREFKWTSECQKAFAILKRALGEAPVIAPPVPSEPFILDTDASNVGMGAVLAQPGPEGERVVAYFSRTFRRPSREEVGPLSPAVKGLWAGFSELRLAEGVLQRGWKAPATGEVTWQVVVP